MSFKLLIECSKDISKLSIDFTDGTSVVTKDVQQKEHKIKHESRPQDKYLDTDTNFSSINQEVIKPPTITREDKPIKVAEELQNLDI